MSHHNHLLTCSVLALLLLTLAVPGAKAQSQSGHELHERGIVIEQPDVVMHVSGLSCGMCARNVTNALQKIDAVEDVQVLLEDDQRILLTLKEGAKVDEKTLREAVTSAGFSTRKIAFKDAQGASS